MSLPVITIPDRHTILVVDDEPDVIAVTKLSLKSMTHNGRSLRFRSASTGRQAIDELQARPDIAVVLLDVVMESDSAGLDACRAIREKLGNKLVRILLRTGQPGAAPERETIDKYDIDGYLPKAELTSTRLYSTVRTALKAWEELVELERHRSYLAAVHEFAVALHSYEPLDDTLERIVETARDICPSPLAVLHLETFAEDCDAESYTLHLADESDPARGAASARETVSRIAESAEARSQDRPMIFEGGILIPLALHRELGYGWIYLAEVRPDPLAEKALTLLAGHTANALYATVALRMLENREGPMFDTMSI